MSTKTIPLLLLITALACSGTKETVELPSASIFDFDKTITEEGLRADLTVISHDSLEGRDTGSEGLRKAARYLSKRYETLGLDAVGDNGTYYQKVELDQPITNGFTHNVFNSEGELINASSHNSAEIGKFRTWRAGTEQLRGEVVFAGYGIKNDSINQYPNDISGKWVMVVYDRANFSMITSAVDEGGALGSILILNSDEESFVQRAEDGKSGFGQPGGMSLSYLNVDRESPSVIDIISPSFAAELMQLENLEGLNSFSEEIKTSQGTFEPMELGFEIEYIPSIQENVTESKNIVAFIEGSDPMLKDEVVVVSSHYDHVGIGRPDSTGDAIYNGADDDGSGTVGVLHVAQALSAAKRAGAGPKRSVLILHVTGEEKGLLGSRYYSDHPIYSVENTVANINVDMIGRRDNENPENPDYIYIIGGKIISSGMQNMLEQANAMSVNIELSDRYNDLEDPNQFYRRSDHWNFGRLGIPFVFFFNGVHPDYHRPSDEIDKIDFEALTKRTQLIYMTTAAVANAEARPEVDNQEFIEKTRQ